MKSRLQVVAPLVPYLAVILGLYCIGSAWAAILIYHAAAIAVLCFCRPKRPRIRRGSPLLYATTLVFAAGGAVLYAVWPLVAPETEISTKLAALGVTKTSWTWFAVYFCAANPLIEEFLWRGLLGSDDTRVHPNDLLFAGYHGLVVAAFVSPIWALPVIAVCVFAGWLWRMLRVQSGGLLLPILTHIVADVSIAAAVYFRLYGR